MSAARTDRNWQQRRSHGRIKRSMITAMLSLAAVGCAPAASPNSAANDGAPVDDSAAEDGRATADGATVLQAADTVHRADPDAVVDSVQSPWERAARRGVDFRAVGQEPGWVLEIDRQGSMHYLGDYGAVEMRVRTPEPVVSAGAERTVTFTAETEAHALEAVIREAPCADTMSGERFTHTVVIRFDGRELQGCGRSLE